MCVAVYVMKCLLYGGGVRYVVILRVYCLYSRFCVVSYLFLRQSWRRRAYFLFSQMMMITSDIRICWQTCPLRVLPLTYIRLKFGSII